MLPSAIHVWGAKYQGSVGEGKFRVGRLVSYHVGGRASCRCAGPNMDVWGVTPVGAAKAAGFGVDSNMVRTLRRAGGVLDKPSRQGNTWG